MNREFRTEFVEHLHKYIVYCCPIELNISLQEILEKETLDYVQMGKKEFRIIQNCSMDLHNFAFACKKSEEEINTTIRQYNKNTHIAHFDNKEDAEKVVGILNSFIVFNNLV